MFADVLCIVVVWIKDGFADISSLIVLEKGRCNRRC